MTKKSNYRKFGWMMAVSFVIMYAVMFSNVDRSGHIMTSYTRTYMTLLMVAPMALLKLLLMKDMYPNRRLNTVLVTVSLITMIGAFLMLRSQTLISDVQYMRAMIPHHSSAIMVSQHANLKDPETKKLAKDIIEAQEREIKQMRQIISRIEDGD